jgi:hypothetical protein
MDPGYLSYVEGHTHARLRTGATLRLARALDVTPATLCGVVGESMGPVSDGPTPYLHRLTHAQCEARLRPGGIGRVVLVSARGPVAHPVNFAYFDDGVVISTDVVQADLLEGQGMVGFEVDEIDAGSNEGWSVLVTGPARRVDDPDEIVTLAALRLQCWAGGARRALVIISPMEITGRTIRHPLGSAVEDNVPAAPAQVSKRW